MARSRLAYTLILRLNFLFTEFDWNQVLIGGVVGALVGLFIWIGKKTSGNNARDRERDDI